jgi:hypothetical protein
VESVEYRLQPWKVLHVTLEQFRALVCREFGGDLKKMTPANMREFLDRVEPSVDGETTHVSPVRLNEPEASYEAIFRDFLRQVLEIPPDQAVIRLWLYCAELGMAGVSDVEADRFRKLFAHHFPSDGLE